MGGARNAGKGLKGKGLGGSLAKRAQRHGAHVGHVAQTGYINYGTGDAGRHTTDANPDGGGGRGGRPNLTSVMERNDMDEFFALADLANRDFTTERSKARVLSMPGGGNASGVANRVAEDAHAAADAAAQAEARADAEALHSDSLKVPRRPPWTKDMSVDQLDRNEKAAFLEWRRALAAVEEDERLTLTPFEKNLEIGDSCGACARGPTSWCRWWTRGTRCSTGAPTSKRTSPRSTPPRERCCSSTRRTCSRRTFAVRGAITLTRDQSATCGGPPRPRRRRWTRRRRG